MASRKIKVMILMGGKTPEHAVSLVSGREVVRHLDRQKFQVVPVVISPSGDRWQLMSSSEVLKLSASGVGKSLSVKTTLKSSAPKKKKDLIPTLQVVRPDVVFIAMHGPFGEDGTIQGMLDLAGLRYTGSGVLASALGMDKIMFRKVMAADKILVPRYQVASPRDNLNMIANMFGYPLVVKPPDQGSSVGVSIVHHRSELKLATEKSFSYSKKILVEEYLPGLELQCAVLGNNQPKALPVIEIKPRNEFFDYEAKYQPGMSEEIVPAEISNDLTRKVQDLAIRVFRAVNAKGFARIDTIYCRRRLYVLEINTIPGLTPNSLLPQEAAAAGMSYPALLDRIIELALEE